MTAVLPTQRPELDQPKRAARKRRRMPLGNHVASVVRQLQARMLAATPPPDTVRVLAQLRRGIGREPGFDYTLGDYLAVPDDLLGGAPGDTVTDAEHAAHIAITHYALHQQSKREPMHVDGRGLGTAMAMLISRSDGPDGIRRRFAALGTANTYQEAVHHLRGLVTLLRSHDVGLDYGLLADDLRTLRRPDGRTRIQATWGRELFHNHTTDKTPAEEKQP